MRHQTSRGSRTQQQQEALLHPGQEVGQLGQLAGDGASLLPALDGQQFVETAQFKTVELRRLLVGLKLILGN